MGHIQRDEATLRTEAKRIFYAKFNLEKFHARVTDFWRIDFSDRSNEVVPEMERALRIDDGYVFPFYWKQYLPSTPFFRVRKLPLAHLQNGLTENDLWEAPQEKTPLGRLNLPNESLLYTAVETPNALMDETDLSPGDFFVLIKYNLVHEIFFKTVEKTDVDEALTDRELNVEEAITEFVRSVLLIPASHYGSETYTITQQVLRHFYSLAPEETGWTYESTRKNKMINAAITPESGHKNLRINTVLAGHVNSIDTNNEFFADYFAYSDGQARWGNKIGFDYFPKHGLGSLEKHIEWTESAH